VSHSIVLFLFASQGLEHLLASAGLPTIPLVPVSSSQAVIGAVVGIALLRGGRGLRPRLLGGIVAGWAVTPFIAGVMCFVALFFLQNVFNQNVHRDVVYSLSAPVLERLETKGVDTAKAGVLAGQDFVSARALVDALAETGTGNGDILRAFVDFAEVDHMVIDGARISQLRGGFLSADQLGAVRRLAGQSFMHRWRLDDALIALSPEWAPLPDTTVNKIDNRKLDEQRRAVYNVFRVPPPQ
jgi:PiT family inorganic phosphate transporter